VPAFAGEISGLPPALLPGIDRDFALNFSNDFLGRGGSVDDFRTQQLIVSAKLNNRWLAVVDHSILTLSSSRNPGRIDWLSASLGYTLLNESDASGIRKITLGGGLRGVGDFAGERMQNGFHRLIGSNIDSLPYVSTSGIDVTAWVEGQLYRPVSSVGSWTTGYWLRAGSLITSGRQWDSTVNALVVASGYSSDFWIGLRHDWRAGYSDDNVQRETARAEEDSAVVLGMRMGALVLETVQQLNNDASYGQLTLVASGVRSRRDVYELPKSGIEFGFLVPDVEMRLAARYSATVFANAHSNWREYLVADLSFGEPQYQSDDTLFVDVQQIALGMEWERPVVSGNNWLGFYAGLGVGWRGEQLLRESANQHEKSSRVETVVVTVATGIRIFAARMGARWNYRLQLGLRATVPAAKSSVQIGTEQYTLQKPSLGISIGMTFDFE